MMFIDHTSILHDSGVLWTPATQVTPFHHSKLDLVTDSHVPQKQDAGGVCIIMNKTSNALITMINTHKKRVLLHISFLSFTCSQIT